MYNGLSPYRVGLGAKEIPKNLCPKPLLTVTLAHLMPKCLTVTDTQTAPLPRPASSIRFVDLFCGIGGFHLAVHQVCTEQQCDSACVFASDKDEDVQSVYETNFRQRPCGDITQIAAETIPDHDILFAGFPCQPFSICGDRKGFADTRGTLFF